MPKPICWGNQLGGTAHWDKGGKRYRKVHLLLQHIKLNLKKSLRHTLYLNLDDIWFNNHSLVTLIAIVKGRAGTTSFLHAEEAQKINEE